MIKLKEGARITVPKEVNEEGNSFFRKEQAVLFTKHFYCGHFLQSQGRARESMVISSNHV